MASKDVVDRNLRYWYGITRAQRDAQIEAQDGRCPICGRKFTPPPSSTHACVDHDEETGEIRGVLCMRCNHNVVGNLDWLLRETGRTIPEIMQRIQSYLEGSIAPGWRVRTKRRWRTNSPGYGRSKKEAA